MTPNDRPIGVAGAMAQVRTFSGGATRDTDIGKLDFDGVLSPEVIECFAKYMDFHRDTAAGRRDSDNWQHGFPLPVLMKSMWRHFFALWKWHRSSVKNGEHPLASACGIMFNLQCYMMQMIRDDPTMVPGMMTALLLNQMKKPGDNHDDS
jgi:hypothetical protein